MAANGGIEATMSDEETEPYLVELTEWRHTLRICTRHLFDLHGSLCQKTETGRAVDRPEEYQEMAKTIEKCVMPLTRMSDDLTVKINETISNLNEAIDKAESQEQASQEPDDT